MGNHHEMAQPSGRKIGYARVQNIPQISLDPQLHALSALGIPDELIFADRKSGTDAEREGLKALLACARPGDTIVVQDIARIGRDLDEVSSLVRDLAEQGISVRACL